MKRSFPSVVLMCIAAAGVACTHHVTLNTTASIDATVARQLQVSVGLYLSPALKQGKLEDRADWENKYVFDNFGAAVSNTINQATRRVFQKVQELEAYPTEQMMIERGLDLVIIPRLNEATLALNTEIGFWGNDAAGAMHLAVEMAVFTREFMQLTMVRATGNGIGEQGIGLFSSGKSEFSVSVENALRDMGNNAVQQLYGNYDIRQFVEALAAEEDETW